MKPSFFWLISMVIMVLFLSNCSGNQIPDEAMPDIGLPIENINRDIEMKSPNGFRNSFRNGERLTLMLIGISEYQIKFPMDYGSRLFAYRDDQWIEIENNMHYPTVEQYGELIISPSRDDILKQHVFSVVPYSPDLKTATPVRLIIVGNVVKNGKAANELTVGYFDFVLNP